MRNDFSVSADEGCVSCRTSSYTIQQLTHLGLPVGHVVAGTGYTLEELRDAAAFIPWDPYLVFFQNAHRGVSDEQFVTLCTSYNASPYLRPLMTAAGLWYDPARYFEWVAAPDGAIPQLFRCLEARCERVGRREVVLEERLRPGYAAPPDLFWESQAIGFGALPTYFGLGPAVVTWEPIDRGAAFRVRLPRRRPVRTLLSVIASWFRRETAEDLRAALLYGHERSLRLEREAAARKRAEAAIRKGKEQLRRVSDAIPGVVYQYALEPDGTQGFTFVSGGAVGLTGYTPEELLADAGIVWRQVLPEFVPGVQASVAASARDGTPWHQEFQFRTKGGDVRWVCGHSVPEPPDGPGRVVWNGILTDVTAERATADALAATERRLTEVAGNLPGVLFQFLRAADGTSRVSYVSDGIRGLLGYTPEEITHDGRNPFELVHPDQQAVAYGRMRASAEGLAEWAFEGLIRRADGRHIWLRTRATPTRTPDGGTVWNGVAIDVTDQKQAEAQAREHAARLEAIAAASLAHIHELDRDGVIRYCNRASRGRTVAEVVGRRVTDFLPPGDRDRFPSLLAGVFAAGEPFRGELVVPDGAGDPRTYAVTVAPVRAGDRIDRVVLTGFDITDRRAAEAGLRARDDLLRKLSEQVPGVIYQFRQWPDGRSCFPYASEGLRSIYEVTPDDVRDSAAAVFARLHPGDTEAVVASISRSAETLEEWRCEYRVRLPARGERWLKGHSQPERLPDGSTLWHGHISDITDRKLAEAAVRESQERLRIFIENVPAGVVMLDRDLRYLSYSRRWLADYNLRDQDLYGRSHYEIFPDIPERWKEIHRRCLTGIPERCDQDRFDRPDGTTIYLRWEIQPWYDATGSVGGLVFFTEVITERVRADTAVRESEEKLRTILDNEPECVKLLDREGRLLEMNPAGLRMVEAADLNQVRGAAVGSLVTEDDRPRFNDMVAAVFRGEARQLTFGLRGLRGTARVLETQSVPLWAPDRREVKALLGVTRDVTEQVRAERREAEHMLRLRTLAELSLALSGEPGAVFDRVVRMIGELFAVRVVCLSEIVGAELLFRSVYLDGTVFANAGRCPVAVTPCATVEADREVKVYDRVADLFPEAEFLRRHAARSYCGIPSVDNEGQVVAVTCLLDDRAHEYTEEDRHILRIFGQRLAAEVERGRVTSERQRAEAETVRARDAAEDALGRLKVESARAEQFFRLVEVAGQGVGIARLDGSLTYLNPFFRRLLDLPPDADIGPHAFWEFVPPEGHRFLAETVLATAREVGTWTGEFDLRTAAGRAVSIVNNVFLMRDPDGAVVGYANIATDITERKRAEEAVREAEYRQRLALDAGRMGTWDWEVGTDRVIWDDREVRLFGLPPGGFDGRLATFLGLVHPDDRAAIHEGLAAAAAGRDFDGEFRIVRPAGEVRWVHASGAVRPGTGDRPARLVGISYDVTERVEAEARLRDSVREKEAMLKEIHHRVKNNLQVVSSLLNLQAERLPDPADRVVVRESQSRVRAMALVHETLYGSESLARIQLPQYLHRLCDSLLQTFGGGERITVEQDVAPIDLDLDRALPAGLIVSELVSNALKYAFPDGRRGRIRLAMAMRGESDYILSVSDDGVGLPADLDLERATSLGLYLVRVLTRQLRGTMDIRRTGGTTFTLGFPQ